MSRKLNLRVREAVARIVENDIADPRLTLVTITDVDVSADSSYATVYYSTIDPDLVSRDPSRTGGDRVPAPREVEAGFEAANAKIRVLLGERLSTRRTPELRFEPDPVAERASRVETLLRELRSES